MRNICNTIKIISARFSTLEAWPVLQVQLFLKVFYYSEMCWDMFIKLCWIWCIYYWHFMGEIIRFYWLLEKLDGKQQDWTIVQLISLTKILFSPLRRKTSHGSRIWKNIKCANNFVSSVRSSYSHPDLLVTQQHHPTFSDHTGPQHWTFTFWATTAI